MNKAQLAAKFAEMCNLGLDKMPVTLTLTLVRRAIAVVSAVSPEWFISYVGPFFYDKRREIAAEDLNFFLTRSWEEQYSAWGFMGGALARQWEDTIKSGVAYIEATDPAALRSVSKSLVAMYCRYLILCKSEEGARSTE